MDITFVKKLIASPEYLHLRDLWSRAPAGSLLEQYPSQNHESWAARIENIRWALQFLPPEPTIVETGTAKGYFGFVLTRILPPPFHLHTFDHDDRSRASAEYVNQLASPNGSSITFHLGNCAKTLRPALNAMQSIPQLAWVDADHSFESAYRDTCSFMEVGIPTILLDDFKQCEGVREAARQIDRDWQDLYIREPVPHYALDHAGIVCYRRSSDTKTAFQS